jgi:hypothetical protein
MNCKFPKIARSKMYSVIDMGKLAQTSAQKTVLARAFKNKFYFQPFKQAHFSAYMSALTLPV